MTTARGRRKILIFGLISKHPGRNRGGTALSIRRLANFFAGEGLDVLILMRRPEDDHFLPETLHGQVSLHTTRAKSKLGLFRALLFLARRESPEVILALDSRACLIASRLTLVPTLGSRIWASFRNELNPAHGPWLRRIARRCEGVICNSHGLAEDFLALTGVAPETVHVLYNLAVSPDIDRLADQPPDHPWLQADAPGPVICTAARLVPEKGIHVLLDAFALLKRDWPTARLIILGQGPLQEELERQARALGSAESIDFAGFRKNPWAIMARSQLFVLPSLVEAFGNVVAEALSLGIPVVATRCPPNGPEEILQHGRYGRLVPPGDSGALAEAMLKTLQSPLPRVSLVAAAHPFREETAGRAYLQLLGLSSANQKEPA